MKTLKMILLIMLVSLFSSVLSAQVSVGINIGSSSPRYYYLQDIEAYFDIQASMYIYPHGGRWIRSRTLPSSYGNYDMNNGHRVIINDYRGSRPYNYYNVHREKFPKGHYDNPNNSWSYKEHKSQGNKNNGNGKNGKGNNGRGNGKGNNGRGNRK